jgi:cell division transport system permease protein
MLGRTLINTIKQIKRSGWIAWSSVAVMTLAFFVGSVFASIAYISHVYIQSIETKDNMLVFFEVGTDPDLIARLRSKWEGLEQIRSIDYTAEEEAYRIYFEETAVTEPIYNQLLQEFEEKRLASSLDIRLETLDFLAEVRQILLDDINAELSNLDYDAQEPPIILKVDDESLDQAREIFLVLRVSGIILLTLLFVIIFFFILMTVEYRTYNRMEEIGVMQLVGGSLGYIRSPYILEGAFYGAIGALLSALVIGALIVFLFVFNKDSSITQFIIEQLHGLNLPDLRFSHWVLIGFGKVVAGGILGAFISYLAIRRYIK